MKRIILLVVAAAVLLTACSSPEQKARKLLSQKSVAFTQESFLASVAEGHAEEVCLFLQAGMSPDAEKRGITALMDAARRGHTDVALALIDAGANISPGDESGVTPLMYAAISGAQEVIKKLIAAGADVNAQDNQGATALQRAEFSPENEKVLKEAGARE